MTMGLCDDEDGMMDDRELRRNVEADQPTDPNVEIYHLRRHHAIDGAGYPQRCRDAPGLGPHVPQDNRDAVSWSACGTTQSRHTDAPWNTSRHRCLSS